MELAITVHDLLLLYTTKLSQNCATLRVGVLVSCADGGKEGISRIPVSRMSRAVSREASEENNNNNTNEGDKSR